MDKNNIVLRLSKSEALVFFEFLSRFTETDTLKIEDLSEQRVLWNLTSLLEKELIEPLQDNYEKKLNEARLKMRDTESLE